MKTIKTFAALLPLLTSVFSLNSYAADDDAIYTMAMDTVSQDISQLVKKPVDLKTSEQSFNYIKQSIASMYMAGIAHVYSNEAMHGINANIQGGTCEDYLGAYIYLSVKSQNTVNKIKTDSKNAAKEFQSIGLARTAAAFIGDFAANSMMMKGEIMCANNSVQEMKTIGEKYAEKAKNITY